MGLVDRATLKRRLLKIVDKETNLVPLVENDVQEYLNAEMCGRDIVLKARQMGITTHVLGDYFLDMILPKMDGSPSNITVAIVSYNDQHTQLLLDKVKTFYDNLPEPKPAIEHDSVHMKSFPTLGSKIYIGTAGARVFGLGDTLHRVLLSEYAYWEDTQAKKIRDGIEQAVPLSGKIVIENTANGEGGQFYDLWNDRGGYHKIFLPWYAHAEYALPEGSPHALPQDRGKIELTADEVDAITKYNLTAGQIRWRRMKQHETKEMFLQWYPEDPVSCFLTSGGSVFGASALSYLGAISRPPAIVEQDGALKIWGLPRLGERYIIGADCSDLGNDYDAAVVLNQHLEHKATLRGKWEVNEYGLKLCELAKKYNNAFVVVERNNCGVGVLVTMETEHYPFLYRVTEAKSGWVTSRATKPRLVAVLKDAIDSLAFTTYDADLVREFRTFRKDEEGFHAKSGAHDDAVMAAGLAVVGLEQMPTPLLGGTRSESYGWAAKGL